VDAPVVAALGALWIAHSGLTARSDTCSSRRRDSPSPILGPLAGRKSARQCGCGE
jgi:hypothetical protein